MANGTITDTLLYHFPLNNIREIRTNVNSIIDQVSGKYIGHMAGEATIASDGTLGLCLEFDGSSNYIEVTPPPSESPVALLNEITIMAWVYLDKVEDYQTILADRSESFLMGISGNSLTFSYAGLRAPSLTVQSLELLNISEWNHLAVTFDHTNHVVKYFVNGILSTTITFGRANLIQITNLQIGNYTKEGNIWGFLDGKMAHLRIYSEALTESQVAGRMQDDLASAIAFYRSHPLDFQLYNADHQSVLFISNDPNGQAMTLEMHNISNRDLHFINDGRGHLNLQFRVGILNKALLSKIAPNNASGWTRVGPPVINAMKNTVGLLFNAPKDFKLGAGESIRIPIQFLAAAPAGGARSTLVEVAYQNIKMSGDDESTLQDAHLMHLNIVNHHGRRDLQAHVGIIGSNRILNEYHDNISSELNVQFTNLLNGPLKFSPEPTGPSDYPGTRILISFDVEEPDESKDWAIAKAADVDRFEFDIKRPFHTSWNITKDIDNLTWTITPKNEITLEYNDRFTIRISNIKSNLPPGTSKIYFRYENIPGFWNGQFVIPVEKSPIFVDNNGNVGIGTTNPKAKLEIGKDEGLALRVEPAPRKSVYIGRSTTNSIQYHYGKGTAINSTASVSLNIDSNNIDDNIRYFDFRVNGNGFNGGESIMRIKEDGNIGIGTTNPGAKLHINGDLKLDGKLLGVEGIPGLVSITPHKPTGGNLIEIGNLDLKRDKMYMLVMKLHNPLSENFYYQFELNKDKTKSRYNSAMTQQFEDTNRAYYKPNGSFANAGRTAHHFFTAYVTLSSSGGVVIHGQGGFETPPQAKGWGYQLWQFLVSYQFPSGKSNVTNIRIRSGGNRAGGQFGDASEVLVYKWGW